MRKITGSLLRPFITLYVILLFLISPAVLAQEGLNQQIPLDPNVRIGKLDNGLTYYIRKNSKPENRVEFRLAVNAGSVLESDDQQGLAHFVEHMAFNGSKNFAKNDLIHYLQSVGVKFGPELNAFTSFDETVYMLTIPTDTAAVLEKGYQVMEDWAHNLTFDTTEIRKERGVIMEEWRLGRGPWQRMQDKIIPVLFKGSRYADRLPIGKKEIIQGAPPKAITSFYHDWYRPDLMAFIVVGDINPDSAEAEIKKHFGNIQEPDNPKPRVNYTIPDEPGTDVVVTSDAEAPYTIVEIASKTDPHKLTTLEDLRNSIIIQLITGMLNQRLNVLKEQANPPILYSYTYFGELSTRAKDAYQSVALVPEGGIDKGLKALAIENKRAVEHGFTPGELARQKKEIYSSYENAYNERDKTESKNFASEYVNNYLTQEPIPGIGFEYDFVKKYLDGITLDEVNEMTRKIITDTNRDVIVMAPQKQGIVLPTEKSLLSEMDSIDKVNVAPYVDKLVGEQLMPEKPKKGKVLLTKKNDDLGVVEMKLSNGARVILKPTDFKNDQILFSAYAPGGYSVCNVTDNQSAMNAAAIVRQTGVAGFSPTDLDKLLSGKTLNMQPYITAYFQGFSGSAAPKDLESMLQLMYLYATQPRQDTVLFQSFISKQKGVIKNLLADPENYFDDQVERIETQNSPWADVIPTEQDIDKINLGRAIQIYKDHFADASNFTFLFVGSFKIDSIRPLIETYIASLPSTRSGGTWKDLMIRPPQKKTDKSIYMGKDPKSIVVMYFETTEPWDPVQRLMYKALEQELDFRYDDKLREEMSDIYGMRVSLNLVKIPYEHLEVSINIPCAPENVDKLTQAALDIIKTIQQQGVTDEDLIKIKETERREMEKNLKENNFWINSLEYAYKVNDPGLITQYSDRINAITSDQLKKVANTIDLKKYVKVVLYPAGFTKKK